MVEGSACTMRHAQRWTARAGFLRAGARARTNNSAVPHSDRWGALVGSCLLANLHHHQELSISAGKRITHTKDVQNLDRA
jgi:hypothetical protein